MVGLDFLIVELKLQTRGDKVIIRVIPENDNFFVDLDSLEPCWTPLRIFPINLC
jgi:hypothetical protein